MKEKFHIVSLTPRQQAALVLIMQDVFHQYIHKSMKEIIIKNHEQFINRQSKILCRLFLKFCDIRNNLCCRETIYKAQTILLKLNWISMTILLKAVKTFNKNQSALSTNDIIFVEHEREKLLALLTESAKYTFTDEEIDRAS